MLHIAETWPGLFPEDQAGRARAIEWIFAALNTVEPVVWERLRAAVFEQGEAWAEARLPGVEARLAERLDELSARLGDAEWLDGAFSAGDLLMVAVLRYPSNAKVMAAHPNLAAYVARGEARPAYRRAFAAQRAVNAPRG